MLVSMKELLADAQAGGYAVGAFNSPNFEALTAIIEAAEETGKGIILQHADTHYPLMPLETIAPAMVDMAKKAKVPVCVHLDHSRSIEDCVKAISLGFTSVMFDASNASYEENVAQTALICRLAHNIGVTVEAELGHILQSDVGVGKAGEQETLDSFESVDDVYTSPELAKDFVERTGVDALAISFGNVHGVFKVMPKLDLDRIKLIKDAIDTPLVMHGGSGLTEEEYRTAIKNGIRKINYYTYMSVLGGKAVKEYIENKKEDETLFYHELPLVATKVMKESVKDAIKLFSLEV